MTGAILRRTGYGLSLAQVSGCSTHALTGGTLCLGKSEDGVADAITDNVHRIGLTTLIIWLGSFPS